VDSTVTWSVTVDGFWIDDRIYWTLWYRAWLHFTVHYYTYASAQSRLHCRCLVTAFNGGRSPSSGFPDCPQPQLLASNSNSLQRLNPSKSGQLNCCWPSSAQSILVAGPVWTIFLFFPDFYVFWKKKWGLLFERGRVWLLLVTRIQIYVTTEVSRPAPILGQRPHFYYCQTVSGLLTWGALSHERTGLSFTTAAGHRQCSHSQVRWPYFTVSHSRLSQPGGPSPRIYIPQEQGGPLIPPGTGFTFRRLLLFAGLWWRYSNPLPHGYWSLALWFWL
jgi:hypothetical protein